MGFDAKLLAILQPFYQGTLHPGASGELQQVVAFSPLLACFIVQLHNFQDRSISLEEGELLFSVFLI